MKSEKYNFKHNKTSKQYAVNKSLEKQIKKTSRKARK